MGVIGSAASSVQLVPEIAEDAERLYVFQRTPNWVLPKDEAPYDPELIKRFQDDPLALQHSRLMIWRSFNKLTSYAPEIRQMAEAEGRKALLTVTDDALRARLTPNYDFGRKRPLRSNKFYPAFNRTNVELVTGAITGITPDAVVSTEGKKAIDTLILATGFETSRFLSAIDVQGRGGASLSDAWSEGARAYLGITSPDFPNCFMMYGPNTNIGSIIFTLECQANYIARQLKRMRDEGLAVMEVRREAHDRYNAQLQTDLEEMEVLRGGVNGYYRAASGRVVTQSPYPMPEYRELTLAPDAHAYLTEPV